ncbi:MAG: Maf family protein [bacterium]|nr:Maf family protein [bacterium]
MNGILGLTKPLILASQSPRRRELLTRIGFAFSAVSPDVDEASVSDTLPPHEYVSALALMKALKGAAMCTSPSIVIGSDTTVVLDGMVLNKPVSAHDATRMLKTLSGRTHTVYTGIALVDGGRSTTAVGTAKVTFRDLDDDEIAAYVEGGSPMDKAGAYGIQDDQGAVFVSSIEGCYFAVVGLPMSLLYTTLRDFVRDEQHA